VASSTLLHAPVPPPVPQLFGQVYFGIVGLVALP
jgi:hypothetical protein